VTLLPPGRVRPESSRCIAPSSSSCLTCVRPALPHHSRARTRVFAPPGPTLASAEPLARARQPRLQRPPRTFRSTPVNTANFRTPSRARSRHPLGVAHVPAAPAPAPTLLHTSSCTAETMPLQLLYSLDANSLASRRISSCRSRSRQLSCGRRSCALLPRTHSSCAAQLLLSLSRHNCCTRLAPMLLHLPIPSARTEPLPRASVRSHTPPAPSPARPASARNAARSRSAVARAFARPCRAAHRSAQTTRCRSPARSPPRRLPHRASASLLGRAAALAWRPPCAPASTPPGPASHRACAWPLPRPTGRAAAASCSRPPAPSPAPGLAQRLRSFRASRQRLGHARAPLGPLRLRLPPGAGPLLLCHSNLHRVGEEMERERENRVGIGWNQMIVLPVEEDKGARVKRTEEKDEQFSPRTYA
jgi:hypothetical protein